jgi:hypothetical protein
MLASQSHNAVQIDQACAIQVQCFHCSSTGGREANYVGGINEYLALTPHPDALE